MSEVNYRETLKQEDTQSGMKYMLESLTAYCHGLAVEGGWWDKSQEAKDAQELLDKKVYTEDSPTHRILVKQAAEERNPLELIALIQSEASEALEGVRKGLMDDHLPNYPMETVEMADIIVRVLDYCGGRGLDVGGALVDKLVYNIKRADHQPENRKLEGGKKY